MFAISIDQYFPQVDIPQARICSKKGASAKSELAHCTPAWLEGLQLQKFCSQRRGLRSATLIQTRSLRSTARDPRIRSKRLLSTSEILAILFHTSTLGISYSGVSTRNPRQDALGKAVSLSCTLHGRTSRCSQKHRSPDRFPCDAPRSATTGARQFSVR